MSRKALTPERLTQLTTAQRDALTPTKGDHIYNTTLDAPQVYDGSAWGTLLDSSGRTHAQGIDSQVTNLYAIPLGAAMSAPALNDQIGFDGTNWTLAGKITWDKIARTSASRTTTGQLLVDITDLLHTLVANTRYEFEVMLRVSTSAVATGTRYGLGFTGTTTAILALVTGTTTALAVASETINADETATTAAFLTANSVAGIILMKGFIQVGASGGDLTVQHLKVTSGTSTIAIGSALKTRVAG